MHTTHLTGDDASSSDPCATHFGRPLPRGLRDEAKGMSWQRFLDTYAPKGALRLGTWNTTLGRDDTITCRATIAFADRIRSMQATSSGPIGAMTTILHDLGISVQIVGLHQQQVDGSVTTFLLCESDDRQCWACGSGTTGDEANINALIAGANRLLGTN